MVCTVTLLCLLHIRHLFHFPNKVLNTTSRVAFNEYLLSPRLTCKINKAFASIYGRLYKPKCQPFQPGCKTHGYSIPKKCIFCRTSGGFIHTYFDISKYKKGHDRTFNSVIMCNMASSLLVRLFGIIIN